MSADVRFAPIATDLFAWQRTTRWADAVEKKLEKHAEQ